MQIEFIVKFLSPLLIGGGELKSPLLDDKGKEKNEILADPQGLNAKALRGALRFWFRTMWSGCGQIEAQCHEKEGDIFGSTEKSCLKMRVQSISQLGSPHSISRLPDREGGRSAAKSGYDPGKEFRVTISSLRAYETKNEAILCSTIALWGALGSIGGRSRRGFGSGVVRGISSNMESWNILNFQSEEIFSSSLKTLLNKSRKVFQDALEMHSQPTWNSGYQNNVSLPFFQLQSLDQIFVSKALGADLMGAKGAIAKIHGSSSCDDLGYVKGNDKMSSPFYIRLHQMQNKEFIAVCTFCPENDHKKHTSWSNRAPKPPKTIKPLCDIFDYSLSGTLKFS